MIHRCHWPGCNVEVAPKYWGCYRHWFKLPKRIRDRIWAAYVPGQEVRKDPSDAYLAAATQAHIWSLLHDAERGAGILPVHEQPVNGERGSRS